MSVTEYSGLSENEQARNSQSEKKQKYHHRWSKNTITDGVEIPSQMEKNTITDRVALQHNQKPRGWAGLDLVLTDPRNETIVQENHKNPEIFPIL